MKVHSTLLTLLLLLLCGLTSVVLMKQLGLYDLFANIVNFFGILIAAICFVLLFEPFIDKIPISLRYGQCLVVYLSLAVVIVLMGVLLIPVITNQWDRLLVLFEKMKSLNSYESEMTVQVEKAVFSFLPLLQQLKDGLLCYVLAFFISLEYPDIKMFCMQRPAFQLFFHEYDHIKEIIFQYGKALTLDIGLLFVGQCLLLGLFRVESFIFLALFLALMNIIPYFGSTLALLFIFVVDYLSYGHFRFGMIFCVFLLQQIEANFLQPVLYGKMMNIKPLSMMISILFFGAVFGLVGVLFAPVFAVTIQSILKVKKSSQY